MLQIHLFAQLLMCGKRHEYNLIMGFAATAPAKILETLQAAGKDHNVLIEEDSTVSINNS